MSSIITFDPSEVPSVELGEPGGARRRRTRQAGHPLRWAYLPMIISGSVNAIFLVVYWVPEFGAFPGRTAVLTQLSPLAVPGLTSAGAAVVPLQVGRTGLIAAFLLVVGLALPVLARNRRWQLRLIVPLVCCYLAVVGWLVTALGLVARDALGAAWLGMLLMTAWLAAAAVTVWRSFWVHPDQLPTRPTRVLWLVGLFALLHPLPVAVGRRLFAPELRDAALDLMRGEQSLRMAALVTPEVVAVYLSGVGVALVVWAWYMIVPPLQPLRVPWARRRPAAADPLGTRLLILAVCAAMLALSGYAAGHAGARRAAQIESASPSRELTRACQTWASDSAGGAEQTLALSGPHCSTVSTYSGYRQTGRRELDATLSPVRARTPAGERIDGRVVAARFGAVLVVASSSRFDLQPDELHGLATADGTVLWTFRCDDDQAMTLRFARADGGDDPARGRVTEFAERRSVVAGCGNGEVAINPANGKNLDS